MNLLRLILLIILGYFVIRFFRNVFQPKPPNPHVKGKNKKSGKIIKSNNIEDADYEEIE
jgi:hypothetical protein